MTYTYGMKQRGFSIGTQPSNGFVERLDDTSRKYYDLLVYDRMLTEEETSRYDLDLIPSNEEEDRKATITPMIKQLEKLFDNLNDKFFEGKLETPVITIAPDTCRAYGWFTTWRAWKETGNEEAEGYYEITITSDYLNMEPEEIAGTLLHEMVHLYNKMKGVQDCSNNGHYHNKKFKAAAESHGLIANKVNGGGGYTDTKPTEATATYLKSLKLEFPLYRKTPVKANPTNKSSMRKYVCPNCGTIIRATKEVHVICADCGAEFVEVE